MLPREYAENEVCGIFPVPIPEPIPNNKRKDRKKPADVLYWTEDRRRERESACGYGKMWMRIIGMQKGMGILWKKTWSQCPTKKCSLRF
nr:hypothetical protein [uncultured Acetatifactor sp.]